MLHIIRKQRIELLLSQGEASFSIQQKLSDQYWEFFVPLIDKILTDLSNEDEVLSLDSLTIDLGNIKPMDLDHIKSNGRLVENIKQQLEEQILKERALKHRVNIQHTALSDFHKWISYLRQGYLDWNVEFPKDAWLEHVLESLSSTMETLNHFILEVERSPNFRIRLVRQHSDSFLNRLIKVIAPKHEKLLDKKVKEFFAIASKNKEINAGNIMVWREKFWLDLIQVVSNEFFNSDSAEFKNRIEQIKVDDHSFANPLIDQSRSFEELKEITEIKEAIFQDHVGLVLLHPFLNSLFKQLGLVKDKDFISLDAKEKAIYLLHFAATGKEQPKEYELTVPKLLCSYPIKAAIPTAITLSQDEKEEVIAMMEACIANWEILKKTSVEGLREGFLQRKGKIELGMDKITIQVEKGPIDMLLDYLPWNLNLIKFPWLKQLIHVEWR
ncbi:contractile injection system tape measure protein [Sphingobacterium sp.]|uniref:contractile injection system tape measure protein n=1 Tax=Sphingobacterium sp. TaxID=341027 RepID=UPI0028B0ADD9|nr:contractile injection system tape measure protein [Sphingobacterium sp.]